MDKGQALQSFWGSFGLDAYDEQTVPKNAKLPYITYSAAFSGYDNLVMLSGSIWYRSTSWEAVTKKADEIAERLATERPLTIKFNGGRLYLTPGNPFSQRISDPDDDLIRRVYINIYAEYLSAF